jgi:hypothetical protein
MLLFKIHFTADDYVEMLCQDEEKEDTILKIASTFQNLDKETLIHLSADEELQTPEILINPRRVRYITINNPDDVL